MSPLREEGRATSISSWSVEMIAYSMISLLLFLIVRVNDWIEHISLDVIRSLRLSIDARLKVKDGVRLIGMRPCLLSLMSRLIQILCLLSCMRFVGLLQNVRASLKLFALQLRIQKVKSTSAAFNVVLICMWFWNSLGKVNHTCRKLFDFRFHN